MNRFVPLLFLIAALGLGTWLFTRSSTEPEPAAPPPTVPESAPAPSRGTPVAAEPQRAAPENVAAQPEAPTSEEQRSCLDEQQLFSALQEAVGGDQLRAVAMRGQDFAELRNIDFAGLNDLATQGNSAAMATLGVQNILRANRQTPADAAAFLDDPRQIDSTALEGIYPGDYQNYSPEDLLALQEANYWLYQAALNGRIGALHDYGAVIGAQLRGPVGMKWLSQEEFDALATTDQALF
ncbi:MAG: hypothetical protein AAFZ58_10505, partial [Pseudomonadota bacterium]